MFHVLQAGARGRPGRSPPRASPGPGTTATRSGTPRRSCCRCSPTRCPTAAREALRWRHSTLGKAKDRAAELGQAGRGVPVALDQRRRMLRLLAGRHRGRSTSPPTSPTRPRGTWPRPGTRSSRPSAASSFSSRRRGCGRSLGHHDRTATSASTASPARTSTPPSSTTTSSPTSMAQQNLRDAAAACASDDPNVAATLGVDAEETGRIGAPAPTHMRSRSTTSSACTSSPRRSPCYAAWDFAAIDRKVSAAAELSVLRPVPQAGGQAGRSGAGDVPARGRVHP